MIKIAVADDMPIILEGVRLLLDRVSDFKVVAEYSNGKELLDKISESEADIILTDIDMPVMDGITATKLLLSKHPGKKVIALSMYSDYENYYEMIRSGARGFVLKQSSSNELEKAVRDVSNGGSFFSAELLQNIIFNLSGSSTKKNSDENIPELTKRETELLKYICQGLSNRELAEKLFLSVKTVESQKTKLIGKTEVKNTSGLIIWAIKHKVVNF
jgi:DNA-binding NarL/FixJ family response regulator